MTHSNEVQRTMGCGESHSHTAKALDDEHQNQRVHSSSILRGIASFEDLLTKAS